ncbi:MAG TPA: hypothetical protein VE075_12210 [Thermoanaerobaculia bacterium]|nr:hypothetical protein [Thermoanaerobaculia bacterium]
MDAPPIACTLTAPELRERRAGLLQRVRQRLTEARPLAGAAGYELRFPGDEATVADVLEMVRLESRCCAFLRFRVTLEPAGQAVAVEISGPPGGAEILVGELLPDRDLTHGAPANP